MTSLNLSPSLRDDSSTAISLVRPVYINTVFASWKDISYIFGVEEDWDLIDLSEPAPLDIKNAAFVESIEWANQYTQEEGIAPPGEELLKIEKKILKNICEHWSAERVIPAHLDFSKFVDSVNKYCTTGMTKPELFPIEPPTGNGLEFFQTNAGISFTLYQPFIIPYTELYYEAYDNFPEWNLEDLNGFDVVETIFFLQEKLNTPIQVDLSDWDMKRERIV